MERRATYWRPILTTLQVHSILLTEIQEANSLYIIAYVCTVGEKADGTPREKAFMVIVRLFNLCRGLLDFKFFSKHTLSVAYWRLRLLPAALRCIEGHAINHFTSSI